MTHAKAITMTTKMIGIINEFARPIVEVNINPGKIAHHHQVQITISIQINQRPTKSTSTVFFIQPCGRSTIG